MTNFFRNSQPQSVLIICLVLLFAASCTEPEAKTGSNINAASNAAGTLQADAVLHQKLQTVLQADAAFTQAIGTAPVATLDEKSGAIIEAEMALQKSIDSLEKQAAATNNPLATQVGYFKTILQNRSTVSDLRMLVSADSDDSATMRQTVVQLKGEVAEKNKTIAALERTARARSNAPAGNAEYENGIKAYAPAKSESVADLRQRNKNLSLAFSSLQNKYLILGRNYLVLKQNNERTEKQLEALRKDGNQK